MTVSLDPVTNLICERTGLRLSATQMDSLEALIAERAKCNAASVVDFARSLDDPATMQRLIEQLTVPETYFNRHEEQLDALFAHRIPALLERSARQSRRLRIWSAGCCTGEEPYTIALRAAEAGIAGDVEIVGTDINRRYLEAARAASYAPRSVGRLSPALVERYFTRRDGRFELSPTIRGRVTFHQVNLAGRDYPSPTNGTARVDVILCRNVLMYFDRAAMARAVERFHEALVPEGVLVLGPVETTVDTSLFMPVAFPGAFLFDRVSAPERPGAHSGPMPAAPSVRRSAPAARPTRPTRENRPPSAMPVQSPEDVGVLISRAESLADRGDSAAAVGLLRRAIELDARAVRAHFLLGVLALDHPAEADAHFRRVLYLEPGHWLARWHRARCVQRLGDATAANETFASLERAALAQSPETVVDEREGITCGLLAIMCRQARHP